jgi:hypothetical protein
MICCPRLTILVVRSSFGDSPQKASDDDLSQNITVPPFDPQNRRENPCFVTPFRMLWVQDIIIELLARDGRILEIRQKLQVALQVRSAFFRVAAGSSIPNFFLPSPVCLLSLPQRILEN